MEESADTRTRSTSCFGRGGVGEARVPAVLPDRYEPVATIALGYPGGPEALPEDLRHRDPAPRSREPLGEFAFSGRWGRPSPRVESER